MNWNIKLCVRIASSCPCIVLYCILLTTLFFQFFFSTIDIVSVPGIGYSNIFGLSLQKHCWHRRTSVSGWFFDQMLRYNTCFVFSNRGCIFRPLHNRHSFHHVFNVVEKSKTSSYEQGREGTYQRTFGNQSKTWWFVSSIRTEILGKFFLVVVGWWRA